MLRTSGAPFAAAKSYRDNITPDRLRPDAERPADNRRIPRGTRHGASSRGRSAVHNRTRSMSSNFAPTVPDTRPRLCTVGGADRSGAREGNRTLDLLITSELLCRLSYPGGPRAGQGPPARRVMTLPAVSGPRARAAGGGTAPSTASSKTGCRSNRHVPDRVPPLRRPLSPTEVTPSLRHRDRSGP